MERREAAAERQNRISNEYYAKSNKDRDFLSLCEPIKVGHHSEKRHRKIIEQAQNNATKCYQAMDKADEYKAQAEDIQRKIDKEINIDSPESLDQLKERVSELEAKRQEIKAREHKAFELSNLGSNIRRYKERLETAKKLWEITD